jgi:hypothetical protein
MAREVDEIAYDFWTIKSEHAFKQARDSDLVVILPTSNELQVDIDSEEADAKFCKNLPKFEDHIAEVIGWEKRPSRSEGHYHIYVQLREPVTNEQRITYQLFLGSDPTREILSHIREINGDLHPTLFIEKPMLLLGDGE